MITVSFDMPNSKKMGFSFAECYIHSIACASAMSYMYLLKWKATTSIACYLYDDENIEESNNINHNSFIFSATIFNICLAVN